MGLNVDCPLRSVESVNIQSASPKDSGRGELQNLGQVDVVPAEITSTLRIPSEMIEWLAVYINSLSEDY